MRSAHTPATTRSVRRRFGARCRVRLRISIWCLRSTDSATTERAPPGPASRAIVVRRWRTRTARSRTANPTKTATCGNPHDFAIRHGHAWDKIDILAKLMPGIVIAGIGVLISYTIQQAQIQSSKQANAAQIEAARVTATEQRKVAEAQLTGQFLRSLLSGDAKERELATIALST